MARTIAQHNDDRRLSNFGSGQCLPAPLDYEVIREALRELDAGQRNFVMTCVESFQVKTFSTRQYLEGCLLTHIFLIAERSSIFLRFDIEHPASGT
jgi:hypothetical protein